MRPAILRLLDMAANSFYHQDLSSDQNRYTPYSQDSQPQKFQSTPSKYPSPYSPPQVNTYSDDTPLHHKPKMNTSNLPPPIETTYPPSPESQQPKPAMLESPRSRRSKRKRGFFSGRVPWFVYLFTLIQISVFIGEIIKNCECVSWQQSIKTNMFQQLSRAHLS